MEMPLEDTNTIRYKASPTIQAFFHSSAFVRTIMGPVGSGKTSGCVMAILQHAQKQHPHPTTGIRYSRYAVIRETYPQLQSTTLKTWRDWTTRRIPGLSKTSPIKQSSPISQLLKINDFEAEILFLAAGEDDDVEKLKSLELTAAWMHEMDGISEEVFKMALSRINRFPSKMDGGPVDPCLWGDYNAVDPSHWLYIKAEEEKPINTEFFKQPPAIHEHKEGPLIGAGGKRYAVNPGAENIEWLPDGYYQNLISNATPDWIQRFLMNQYGYMKEGMPVYEGYVDHLHCAQEPLHPWPGLPLILGFDFALKPACLISQLSNKGQLRILDEVVVPMGRTMGLTNFLTLLLKPKLTTNYPGYKVTGWGDPSGEKRADTDEKTAFDVLHASKFPIKGTHTNKIKARIDAVEILLSSLAMGEPRILISPTCVTLRAGFLGKYHYEKKASRTKEGIFHNTPDKGHYSHIHDSLQYISLGVAGPTTAFEEENPNLSQAIQEQEGYGPMDNEVGY